MTYKLVHTPQFDRCVEDYIKKGNRDALFDLQETTLNLRRQPFGNPTLQTHQMRGVKGPKRFISDVGGRAKGRRVIWSRFDREIVLLLFGEHDDVERRAERLDFILEPDGSRITIVEGDPSEQAEAAPAGEAKEEPGQLFMAWTDRELAAFGFGDHEVPVLRRLDTEEQLMDLTLSDESFNLSFNLLAYQNPDGPTAEKVADDDKQEFAKKAATVLPQDEADAAKAVRLPQSRKHFAPLSEEELDALLTAPIEEWMVFLHPDQAKLTQRPFSGPARVRGAAGTGKTVVALHRAKHVAQTYNGKVLFTTYVTNLPPVFEQLFKRFAPDLADRVEFRNLHSLAHGLVREHGSPFQLDPDGARAAFSDAWTKAVASDGPLRSAGLTRSYLQQEVEWIIKGRGLGSLEDYRQLARTGRGTPLNADARTEAWALYEEYQRQLDRRGLVDFSDLLLKALELLESGRVVTPYRGVVIDEAQDLTEVGIRLAHALAGGDQRDGLFLVGDGQQSIYPGGYSLKQVGIDVRGRSSLLKVNYRNTREVAALAKTVVAGHAFDDGDDQLEPGDRDLQLVRDGQAPELHAFADVDDHDEALVMRISELAQRDDTGPGDIAVLVPTNKMVKEYDGLIRGMDLNTQKLQAYDGLPNDKVKVGTYQRGKGLEFKRVLLPRLDADGIAEGRRHGEDDATHRERLELLRRQVFVAITRARDGVWCGWVDEPADMFSALAELKQEQA